MAVVTLNGQLSVHGKPIKELSNVTQFIFQPNEISDLY